MKHTYHVTTEKRTYNCIECLEHLIKARGEDMTPTLQVCEWVNGKGWVKIDKEEMVQDYESYLE